MVCCLLVYIGQAGLRDLYIALGIVFTLYYFTFFLFIISIADYVEKTVTHREITLVEIKNNTARDMMRKYTSIIFIYWIIFKLVIVYLYL